MKKEILVVDIETTGFIEQGGKIVEIGIVKLNLDTGNITPAYSSLVKETGFDISHTKGKFGWIFKNSDLTFEEVQYAPSLESQKEIIQGLFNDYQATAYYKEFDFGFLKDRGFKIKELPCPMLLSTPILNLPSAGGFTTPKWPKVEEAWEYFFGQTGYIETHRGLDDAKHEAKIVFELYKLDKFKVAKLKQYDLKSDSNVKVNKLNNDLSDNYWEITDSDSGEILRIKKNPISKYFNNKELIPHLISKRNLELFTKIYNSIPLHHSYRRRWGTEIINNEAYIDSGYKTCRKTEECFTKSLLYIDLYLKGFRPHNIILSKERKQGLVHDIIFKFEELFKDAKIFAKYIEMGYSSDDFIYEIYHDNSDFQWSNDYNYFDGYSWWEDYGITMESIDKFEHNISIQKGKDDILYAIDGYLFILNPTYCANGEKIDKYIDKYKSISAEARDIFTKIDNALKRYILSPNSDFEFFLKHIYLLNETAYRR